ncbi:unnamed protein product, partial [Mesorhabditis belari]|uniref:Uncharacterized protein n=1 Tax=Mesorhabditis belari TaxID=2138241 RepID=A0AAF3EMM6_9BILA
MRLVFSFLFVVFLLSEVSAQGENGNNTRVTNASDTTTTARPPVDPKVTPVPVVSSNPGKPGNDSTTTTGKPAPRINSTTVDAIKTTTTRKPAPRINATTVDAIKTTTDDYDDYSSTSNITNTTTDGSEPPLEKMAISTKIALGVCILVVIIFVIIGCFSWKYYKKGGSIPFITKRKEKTQTKGYEKLKLFDEQMKTQSDRASAIES